MLPEEIDNTNFKYITVDNKYMVSICIKSLPSKIYFLDVIKEIDKTIEYDMSIYHTKLNYIKALNKITYDIGSNSSELYTVNNNQRNIDVIYKSNEDAKSLRKKILLENQDLYNLSIIFTFYSDNLKKLYKIISNFKAKLYSKGISADVTNFRHLDFYLMNLPLNIQTTLTEKLYITTDALANIFPFYTNYFMDTNGIIIGYTKKDRRICMLDIFSNQYENSNICILGCSGSGKSFFTKLFIVRNFFKGKKQIIFDLEDEYFNIGNSLGGQILFKDNIFNILQFTKKDLDEKDFFNTKIGKVIKFISAVTKVDDYIINILKTEIKALYYKFNITEDIKTLYKNTDGDEVFLDDEIIDLNKFPTLIDLFNNTQNNELKSFLKKEMETNLKYFSGYTNLDLDNKLYIINVKNVLQNESIIIAVINNILDECLGKEDTIIYIDEMWKYAKSEKILDSITNMYKTIRKRKASIITITQDITDFFSYKDGYYANSILNNSCFKMIFKTQYKDISKMKEISSIEGEKISVLKKGEAFLIFNINSVQLKIVSNEFEREILNENDNSYK